MLRTVLLCVFLACVTSLEALFAAPPNVVIFLADDLGWSDLGCQGSLFYETPHLDRMAAAGMRFTNAYAACPVCSPTRASMVTGRWPQRTGITDYIGAAQPAAWKRPTALLPAPYAEQLALEETTLAEVLKRHGYATLHAGKWHLGGAAFWPEQHGYDLNFGGIDRGGPYGGKKYFSPYDNPRLTDGPEGEHIAERLATECGKFIEANRERPFFVSFCFYDVHTPLMTKPELQQKYQAKRTSDAARDIANWPLEGERPVRQVQDHAVYAGMVETMDGAAGIVLNKLAELRLEEETLVIFTSDNGGLSTSEGSPTSNLPLRGGKGWMYEGGIRVPFLARWKGVIEPGQVSDRIVVTPDVFATVIAATGIDPVASAQDSISFLPTLQGHTQPPRPAACWHYPHYGNQGGFPSAAVREGDFKLIENYETRTLSLFNVTNDVGETHDLATEQPAKVQYLKGLLDAWCEDVGAVYPTERAATTQ